jgi:hypothetical protein
VQAEIQSSGAKDRQSKDALGTSHVLSFLQQAREGTAFQGRLPANHTGMKDPEGEIRDSEL